MGPPRTTSGAATAIDERTTTGISFALTDEQKELRALAREFAEKEIRPLEADLDPDAYELNPEDDERLRAMVKDMGMYQMGLPTEYGGPGIDIVTRTMLAEEMSQHRAGQITRAAVQAQLRPAQPSQQLQTESPIEHGIECDANRPMRVAT